MTGSRALKAVLALILLLAVAFFVYNWYGDYRAAKEGPKTPASSEATGSAGATGTAPGGSNPGTVSGTKPVGTVLVLIEGLNFRAEPNKDSKLIRGLKKGESLTLIRTEADWHLVSDAQGVQGWISASPQYTEIKK